MKITLDNYEQFAIDFVEGNLDAQTEGAFRAFLLAHPDVAHLVEGLPVLADSPATDSQSAAAGELQQQLHLPPSPLPTWDDTLCALLENTLTQEESAAASGHIAQSPVLQREWQLMQKTRLVPDEAVVFPNKASLLRKATVVRMGWVWMSAAASIALLLAVWWMTPSPQPAGMAQADQPETEAPQSPATGSPTADSLPKLPQSKEDTETPAVRENSASVKSMQSSHAADSFAHDSGDSQSAQVGTELAQNEAVQKLVPLSGRNARLLVPAHTGKQLHRSKTAPALVPDQEALMAQAEPVTPARDNFEPLAKVVSHKLRGVFNRTAEPLIQNIKDREIFVTEPAPQSLTQEQLLACAKIYRLNLGPLKIEHTRICRDAATANFTP